MAQQPWENSVQPPCLRAISDKSAWHLKRDTGKLTGGKEKGAVPAEHVIGCVWTEECMESKEQGQQILLSPRCTPPQTLTKQRKTEQRPGLNGYGSGFLSFPQEWVQIGQAGHRAL